ncbi:MAG: hypothetical protein RL722_1096, partial [Pseudomonadota bacterium]
MARPHRHPVGRGLSPWQPLLVLALTLMLGGCMTRPAPIAST